MMTTNIKAYKAITPTFPASCYIDPSAVLVGDITLGNNSSVWPLVAARGDVNKITIGQRTNIQDGSVLHVTRKTEKKPNGQPLVIGDDVTIGHMAMLHGCTIGDRVLVGMGTIVLDGALIKDNIMLGAGSLVPPGKVLESGFLYMGSPAKQIRPLTQPELEFLSESAYNYVALKNDYISNQEGG